jgi:hypothetical protein
VFLAKQVRGIQEYVDGEASIDPQVIESKGKWCS